MYNIYFAGSIRGGRSNVNDYVKIVETLKKRGKVLTEHVADPNLQATGEKELTKKEIYIRDMEWMKIADVVIAEVSVPSLGVGYELGAAEALGKKVICVWNKNSEKQLSAMIAGDSNFEIFEYADVQEVVEYLEKVSFETEENECNGCGFKYGCKDVNNKKDLNKKGYSCKKEIYEFRKENLKLN